MTIRRLDLGVITASLFFIASCGSSNDSTALSDAEFCQEIERLESVEPTNDISGAIVILRDLIDKAPNPEVRNALKVLEPTFENFATIDENDPEAMSRFFEVLMDDKIVAASEVLDRYSTDVCGLTDEGTTDDISG